MSNYRSVIIETYLSSSKSIRARPIPGQGLSSSMNVECSSKMRKRYPVGTKFYLEAKITNRESGTEFLYAHYNADYRVLNDQEITELLNKIG